MTPTRIELHGLEVDAITAQQCIEHVMQEISARRGGWIITVNVDHLRRFHRDAAYRVTCRRATLRLADGMPLVWASQLQRTPLPERVAGSDLVLSLTQALGQRRGSLFLLGGAPGAAEGAAKVLTQRCPGLRISGVLPAPVGFEQDPQQMREIEQALVAAAPDVVYVALGSPKQENLIDRLRTRVPHAWWVGVGISLSFVTGQVRRAPRWMRLSGLEWLHRLAQEPRRLARRYLIEGLPAAAVLLGGAALKGALRRAPA